MKILTIDFEEILTQSERFKDYDLVWVRSGLVPEGMYEGTRFHASVSSSSSVLGVLKTLDKYVTEELELKPRQTTLRGLGKVSFDYDMYRDFYRVYGKRKALGKSFMQIGRYNADAVFTVINQPLFRTIDDPNKPLPEFVPTTPDSRTKEALESLGIHPGPEFKEVRVVKGQKDVVGSSEGHFLVKGPLLGIKGHTSQIESLYSYLEKSEIEKLKSFDEHQLTKEEKQLFNRYKDRKDLYESMVKMFLIANELGWLEKVDINYFRKDFIEKIKSGSL
jgi:hypothetical protein